VGTPAANATATAAAAGSPSPIVSPTADDGGDSGSDGFPYWIIAPIAVGGLGAAGAAVYLLRRAAARRR
jgi:hypothetical protein